MTGSLGPCGSVTVHEVAPARRSLEEALGLSQTALDHAEQTQQAVLTTSLVDDDAWLLGALQTPPSHSEGRVVRRVTTGRTARVRGRALIHALALPHLQALWPDATAPTLLNRNLRPFLAGYRAAGAKAAYPGRDTLVVAHAPFALVGFEGQGEHALLIELLVGIDHPSPLPDPEPLAGARVLTRRDPVALGDLGIAVDAPLELAAAVHQGWRDRLGAAAAPWWPPLERPASDALPPMVGPARKRRVAIGQMELYHDARSWRLGGDLLAVTPAIRAFEEAVAERLAAGAPLDETLLLPLLESPFDGARPSEILELLRETAAES